MNEFTARYPIIFIGNYDVTLVIMSRPIMFLGKCDVTLVITSQPIMIFGNYDVILVITSRPIMFLGNFVVILDIKSIFVRLMQELTKKAAMHTKLVTLENLNP